MTNIKIDINNSSTYSVEKENVNLPSDILEIKEDNLCSSEDESSCISSEDESERLSEEKEESSKSDDKEYWINKDELPESIHDLGDHVKRINVDECKLERSKLKGIETISVHKRYLGDLSEYVDKYDTIFIRSGQGTGKSHSIMKLLSELPDGKTYLISTNRRSLSSEIMSKSKSFSGNVCLEYQECKRDELCSGYSMTISPESNYKMQNDDGYYNIYNYYWIDETCKGMDTYASSGTLSGNRIISSDINKGQVKECEKLICSDADFDEGTMRWIMSMRGNKSSVLLDNTYKHDDNSYLIHNKEGDTHEYLDDYLEMKKNVYAGFTSVSKCIDVYNKYKDKLDVLIITGEEVYDSAGRYGTGDKNMILMNKNKIFKEYNLVGVSPCILFGTSFDEFHFHVVVYFYEGILTGEYVNQALHRVRHPIDKKIHVYIKDMCMKYLSIDRGEVSLKLDSKINDLYKNKLISNKQKTMYLNILSKNPQKIKVDNRIMLKNILNKKDSLNIAVIEHILRKNKSFRNIKMDILGHIFDTCGHSNVFYVKERGCKVSDILGNATDRKMTREIMKDSILVNARKISDQKYKELKRKVDKTTGELGMLTRGRLERIYNVDITESNVSEIRRIDEEECSYILYLTGNPSYSNNIIDIKIDIINKYEEFMDKLGFHNGIFSTETIDTDCEISNDVISEFENLMKSVKAYNKNNNNGIILPVYRKRNKEPSGSIILNNLTNAFKIMGYGGLKKGTDTPERRIDKNKTRYYGYSIKISEYVLEMIKKRLKICLKRNKYTFIRDRLVKFFNYVNDKEMRSLIRDYLSMDIPIDKDDDIISNESTDEVNKVA